METPIVMPRGKKYGNNYWATKGPKVGMREVILYSDLEFDHWLHVETDPEVVTYCEQCNEIPYIADGVLRSTIFDMYLKYRNGRQLIREVKYSSELDPKDPRNVRTLRQIEAQMAWCKENDYEYEVVTEQMIRSSTIEIENMISIVSFVKNNRDFSPALDLTSILKEEPTKLEVISKQLDVPFRSLREECLWLLYKGCICANLKQTILGTKTEVWLNESNEVD